MLFLKIRIVTDGSDVIKTLEVRYFLCPRCLLYSAGWRGCHTAVSVDVVYLFSLQFDESMLVSDACTLVCERALQDATDGGGKRGGGGGGGGKEASSGCVGAAASYVVLVVPRHAESIVRVWGCTYVSWAFFIFHAADRFGLLKPDEEPSKCVWLDMGRTLEYYRLKSGVRSHRGFLCEQ